MKKFLTSSIAVIAFIFAFSGVGKAYYAEEGDTMSEVAKWHEMDLKDLIDLNPHIKDPNHIHTGAFIITRSDKKPQMSLTNYARSLQEVTAYKNKGDNFPYEVDSAAWVKGIYKKFGVDLPKTGKEQAVTGEPVKFDYLEMGDLMFFSDRKDKEISHVGIYLGDNFWISNFDAANDVEIFSTWNSWAQEHFLWGTRFKL